MLCHFLFVFRAVVDKSIQEEETILEEFQKELVVSGSGLDMDQKMLVIFEDVHDLLLSIDVVEDDLTLEVDLGLQACKGIEGSPTLLTESADQVFEHGADAVDEVQDD